MSDLCSEIEKFGKGIGNASRYRIIEALLKGRKTVGELVGIVKLSQPAVSQHLKVLKACNLVIDERRGQEIFYTLNSKYTLDLLMNLVSDVKKQRSNTKNKNK
ncbi:metalloregulator ArsR/SmtB family transcription factor [Patescibacteria group bacterium]|nr:metalloregulator ArsR/SmtB family transcription factor [Patescibacteria group bacterium]MCL5114510.1 metalloregulator ArsR/SmtB family transcription factor [Patescibacteria group bacterium]